MRKYYILIVTIAFFACQKDDIEPSTIDNLEDTLVYVETNTIDKYITDLKDTLIYAQWANGEANFYFDIDKDSVFDINFTGYSFYSNAGGGNYSESYLKVTPLNGYKIASTDYITTTWSWNPSMSDTIFDTQTVMMPKVFHIGDTLSMNDKYSENSQMINYNESHNSFYGFVSYSGLAYGIQEDEYYLGFSKLVNMKTRQAWLKVRKGISAINLNSCCFIDKDVFVIKEYPEENRRSTK